jgi:hypothetical protein
MMARRLGDFLVSKNDLSGILNRLDGSLVLSAEGLPPDARVVDLHLSWETDCFVIRIEAESLGEVPDGAPVPRLDARLKLEAVSGRLAQLQRANAEMAYAFSDRVQESELASIAARQEREACAAIAEKPYADAVAALNGEEPSVIGAKIANAIRARG